MPTMSTAVAHFTIQNELAPLMGKQYLFKYSCLYYALPEGEVLPSKMWAMLKGVWYFFGSNPVPLLSSTGKYA